MVLLNCVYDLLFISWTDETNALVLPIFLVLMIQCCLCDDDDGVCVS